jgi:hypothetical protein
MMGLSRMGTRSRAASMAVTMRSKAGQKADVRERSRIVSGSRKSRVRLPNNAIPRINNKRICAYLITEVV